MPLRLLGGGSGLLGWACVISRVLGAGRSEWGDTRTESDGVERARERRGAVPLGAEEPWKWVLPLELQEESALPTP